MVDDRLPGEYLKQLLLEYTDLIGSDLVTQYFVMSRTSMLTDSRFLHLMAAHLPPRHREPLTGTGKYYTRVASDIFG